MPMEACESYGSSDVFAVSSITLGIDGRLYCHDLTPDLASVLKVICPQDPELSARVTAGCGSPGEQE